MKAIVQDRYGSSDVLRFEEVDTPTPGDDEVLIRVHAAAVNAADWHITRGDPRLARIAMPKAFGWSGPKARIRGRDFAGRVEAVGLLVTRLQPGDEVFGDLGWAEGAFAEYVCTPDDAVERKPAGLTFEQAAAILLAGNTALVGVRDLGEVRPGQRILVNGASGGVGTFAVQIAKSFGAEVTAVQHEERGPGAVDRRGPGRRLRQGGLRRERAALRRRLRPGGEPLAERPQTSAGTHGDTRAVRWRHVRRRQSRRTDGPLHQSSADLPFRPPALTHAQRGDEPGEPAALAALAESGEVVPIIDRTYPLRETAEAIR